MNLVLYQKISVEQGVPRVRHFYRDNYEVPKNNEIWGQTDSPFFF